MKPVLQWGREDILRRIIFKAPPEHWQGAQREAWKNFNFHCLITFLSYISLKVIHRISQVKLMGALGKGGSHPLERLREGPLMAPPFIHPWSQKDS